jgi:hypothetical protein
MVLKSLGSLLLSLPLALAAQSVRESTVPLNNWPAPSRLQRAQLLAQQRTVTPKFQQPGGITPDDLLFVPLAPCRLADTRAGSGYPALGSTPLASLTPQTLPIVGACGLPNDYVAAEAYSLNVTVVPPGGTPGGYLVVYPNPATPIPLVGSLTWNAGAAYQTAAVITAASSDGSVNVVVRFPTDVVVDINGYYASPSNSYGSLGLGSGALGSASATNYNTAIGDSAMLDNVTGISDTALGFEALAHNTSGSSNTAVGYRAGTNLTAGSNNIMLGNSGTSGDDHTIRIGDVQTSAYIAGILNTALSSSESLNVVIDTTSGQLGVPLTLLSSRRYKDDIRDMGDASDGLLRLRPVTFRYKQAEPDGSKPIEYGLIAEEVAGVYPELVVKGKDGQVETVQYSKLPAMLLNELQKQYQQIQEQHEQIQQQNRRAQEQDDKIGKLEARLAALETQLTSPTAKVPADRSLPATEDGR